MTSSASISRRLRCTARRRLVRLASCACRLADSLRIYAAMHDVVPPAARATAVGLMTLVGFCGAGLAPIGVAQASGRIGMAPAMTSLAFLYLAAAAVLVATRASTRRTIFETRAVEDVGR